MVDAPIGGRAASRWWPPAVVAYPRLRLQLIANRQLADSLSRRREDRVAQGRWDRRHAGLAHAAHRLAVVAGDDVHANLPRRPGHPGHLVGVEVVLFHAAALEADAFQRRDADTHHARALHLGAHPVGVDVGPAIHGDVHTRDRQLALVVDRGLHDRRDVAHEAVVGGDAQSAPLGQLPAPPGLARHGLDDTPQAAGVHGVPLRGFAVVPGVAQGLRAHLAGRTDHLQQKVLGSRPAAAARSATNDWTANA